MHLTVNKTSPLRQELPSEKRAYTLASKRVSCERAHHIADCLRHLLLHTCTGESLCGLSVETVYEAATEEGVIGGDSCDAFALSGGRVALVVADASGKGLEAAERVVEVRFALRAFLCEHPDPALALSCLNDYVCDTLRLGMRQIDTFVTLTLVVVESATGRALCLCAGGEPPLVLRASGAIDEITICGPALGLLRNEEYAAANVRIGPGEAILLATDGLTEARDRNAGKNATGINTAPFLGLCGLAALAREAQRQASAFDPPVSATAEPPADFSISHSIFEAARAFAGGAFHDDACLLIARRSCAGIVLF